MNNITLENFFGRDVSYSKEKGEIYDMLKDDPLSPFMGETMATVFVYAAVFGFENNIKESLKHPVPQIPTSALSPTQKAVLLSLAISDNGGIDILLGDAKRATDVICKYANGGIDILESRLIKGGVGADVMTRMSADLHEMIEKRIAQHYSQS